MALRTGMAMALLAAGGCGDRGLTPLDTGDLNTPPPPSTTAPTGEIPTEPSDVMAPPADSGAVGRGDSGFSDSGQPDSG